MTTPFSTIEDLFSYSTVQIQSTAGLGTGFFFEFDAPTENKKIPCIITNKHVAHDQSATRQITFHCQNKEGQLIEAKRFDIPNKLWNLVDHPRNDIDLCAILLEPILTSIASKEFSIFCPCLNKDNLILDEELKKLTPVNDILMVGYPIGLIDNINNFPIFRRGITASHPGLSFKGKSEFLIDAACWPGSSGSPVFLRGPAIQLREDGRHYGSPFENKLLGILWGGPEYSAQGTILAKEIPMTQRLTTTISIPANLGFVVHAREILKLSPL